MSEPLQKIVYIDMTDERKAHWKRVSDEIIDLLKREFPNPAEAHGLLNLMLKGLQETYGIDDSFTIKERIQ